MSRCRYQVRCRPRPSPCHPTCNSKPTFNRLGHRWLLDNRRAAISGHLPPDYTSVWRSAPISSRCGAILTQVRHAYNLSRRWNFTFSTPAKSSDKCIIVWHSRNFDQVTSARLSSILPLYGTTRALTEIYRALAAGGQTSVVPRRGISTEVPARFGARWPMSNYRWLR